MKSGFIKLIEKFNYKKSTSEKNKILEVDI